VEDEEFEVAVLEQAGEAAAAAVAVMMVVDLLRRAGVTAVGVVVVVMFHDVMSSPLVDITKIYLDCIFVKGALRRFVLRAKESARRDEDALLQVRR